MITLACGYKGGEIVPSFFVGATFGAVVDGLLHLPAGFGAAIGLISVFCGAVNCPLASIILSVELFGAEYLPLFGLSCAISYTLSGYFGLYGNLFARHVRKPENALKKPFRACFYEVFMI